MTEEVPEVLVRPLRSETVCLWGMFLMLTGVLCHESLGLPQSPEMSIQVLTHLQIYCLHFDLGTILLLSQIHHQLQI